ncbi:MAG: hypothetical protein K2R98_16795 [Gemmataceae bacterium]|nr:hypothetical protein [Gemmataceae bacterium]
MKINIERAKVSGEIYQPVEIDMLTQDMLQVVLDNGVIIDVGWYPEHDPDGEYVVIVFDGDSDNQLRDPVILDSPGDVVATVMELAHIFSMPGHNASSSGVTVKELREPRVYA